MKAKFILSACIILFIGVMTLDAQMIERTDAMWVRTVPEGTITLDGVLDEPEWDQAETWVIRYGEDAGMPYSGWRSEGGVPTTDSTHAILRFLVEGDYLYLGATVYDKSIGGSADWAHWDVLLMNIPDRLSPERPTPPGEYMYGWWYPQADTALPAGLGPRFHRQMGSMGVYRTPYRGTNRGMGCGDDRAGAVKRRLGRGYQLYG
jgi:hypothetical protein